MASMDFVASISRLPIPLDAGRAQEFRGLFNDLPAFLADLLAGAAADSPYLAGLIAKEAEWLRAGALDHDDPVRRETDRFEELEPAELAAGLRRAKRRVALQTALADLGGVWSLDQVTGALSDLADRAVDLALRAHVAAEARRGKLPPHEAEAGGVFVLAMGKGGARELNYSSDIDLIVLFDETAYAASDQIEARAALIRATRKMAATLSDVTGEGYVFRTDLRLRPDASVTPVCISTAAALAYYEAEGRTWERAAFIKARAAAGNLEAGRRFLSEMRPFVWRKHLDFAAIQDAHDMRLRIRDHKGLGGRLEVPGHNIKLGQGGIREIEFFTQTRQLIAGGRDPDLRARDTVGGLAALAAKGWIPAEVARELTEHYREHREIEHRIQMVNDAQTHVVPRDRAGLAVIAALMGDADADAWSARLHTRLQRVHALTEDFFAPGHAAAMPALSDEAAAIIARWQGYPAIRSLRAQQIFRRVAPDLLARMARTGHPDEALQRFDNFLSGLPAGVQLFSLFEANPQLIELIVDICGTAPGLAGYLARHPAVLDAVLGGSFFAPWPGAVGLRESAAQVLEAALSGPRGSYERALDAARRWAHEWHFRIGVHHLRGLIDADEAGLQYADLADGCIAALFPVTAADFASRHGPPPGEGAVVLGMGSLGARMLNAGSDLDLIVIYDAAGAEGSEGPRPLATRPYYARLTQAMITAVSALTAEGRLYEVDMRLRPSGRQGPVATAIQSFETYQTTEAWTWEHLALTRARVVAFAGGAGAEALADRVEALRLRVLRDGGGQPRVMPDLAEMRARLFAAKPADGPWEAKTGPGRLQDIELLAQSCALRAGDPARSALAQLRGGARSGLLSREVADRLASAWRMLWRLHASGRLLTDKRLQMDVIGLGGQEFLLRETGKDDLPGLEAALARQVEAAAALIDAELPSLD